LIERLTDTDQKQTDPLPTYAGISQEDAELCNIASAPGLGTPEKRAGCNNLPFSEMRLFNAPTA